MDHHCSPREAVKSEHGNLLRNRLGYSREVSNCLSPDSAHARAVQSRVSIHNPLRTTLAWTQDVQQACMDWNGVPAPCPLSGSRMSEVVWPTTC